MYQLFRKCVVYILTVQARAVLRIYKPRIIAVTGSVGKTSTKDAIYSVVAQSAHVRKSEKSFNSELGLPLTILGVPNGWNNPLRWLQNLFDGFFLIVFRTRYPQWLVLEIGADRPGDISSLATWLKVDIVVITRLPEMPVHVEFFDSPEAVAEEKASLIDALVPQGTLILYGDDERTRVLRSRAPEGAHIITFGLSEHADVRGSDFSLVLEEGKEDFPLGMSAHITIDGSSAPLQVIGTIGEHALLPALAAAAVGSALDTSLVDIIEALGSYTPPPGRMHLVRGIKDSLLIDDTYNSSPAAVTAALDALSRIATDSSTELRSKRRIAVLGDMLELGRYSVEEHRKIGAYAADKVDLLLTVGFRARDIAQGALDSGLSEFAILQFEDSTKAGDELAAMIQPGDCILVKGSQSMRMEKTVETLMAQPERAQELLVRQDEEWKKR